MNSVSTTELTKVLVEVITSLPYDFVMGASKKDVHNAVVQVGEVTGDFAVANYSITDRQHQLMVEFEDLAALSNRLRSETMRLVSCAALELAQIVS